MSHRHPVPAALVGLTLACANYAAPVFAQTPVLESRSIVRIPAGALQGPADLLIHATGPTVGAQTDPFVVVDSQAAPAITFAAAVEIASGDSNRRIWRIPASIQGMPSPGLMLPRTVHITWGSTKGQVQYWISNLAAPVLSWRVDGLPAEWQIPSGCHTLRIASSGTRATGIIVTSTLVEEHTKQPLRGLFLSVDASTKASAARLEAAVNDTGEPVYLCMPGDSAPGKYTGTINVSPAEKPDGAPASTTIHSTNWRVQAAGAALLAIGCLLAFVFRVFAPGRANQTQALLLAAVLREQAAELRKRIDAIQAPDTKKALDGVIASLQKKALIAAGRISGNMPSPFGAVPDAAAYKVFLEATGNLVARLGIIANGLLAATRPGSTAPAGAVQALDALVLGVELMPVADLRKQVEAALTPPALHGQPPQRPALSEPTSQQLTFQLERLAAGVWLAWAGLTFAIGLGVLVLNDPAFGAPLDFLYCFLWGVGVPTAGQQLSGASATTALNVTLPSKSG